MANFAELKLILPLMLEKMNLKKYCRKNFDISHRFLFLVILITAHSIENFRIIIVLFDDDTNYCCKLILKEYQTAIRKTFNSMKILNYQKKKKKQIR